MGDAMDRPDDHVVGPDDYHVESRGDPVGSGGLARRPGRRQALVIIEDANGNITIAHFGRNPVAAIEPLIQLGLDHVLGGGITTRDSPDRIIGYQIEVEGPCSLVMAQDFRTAWDYSQEYWRAPDDQPDPPARRELGR